MFRGDIFDEALETNPIGGIQRARAIGGQAGDFASSDDHAIVALILYATGESFANAAFVGEHQPGSWLRRRLA